MVAKTLKIEMTSGPSGAYSVLRCETGDRALGNREVRIVTATRKPLLDTMRSFSNRERLKFRINDTESDTNPSLAWARDSANIDKLEQDRHQEDFKPG